MGSPELHTAEHIFARALQNLGIDLHVTKVDTESSSTGVAFFNEKIGVDTLIQAESIANETIAKGLDVSEELFSNMEEAKKRFQNLRLNEERLQGKEALRVVKIGDYDYSMCSRRHASNTSQIGIFSLKAVYYPQGHTKVEFVVGKDAIRYLLLLNGKLIGLALEHNFKADAIDKEHENALRRASNAYAESEAVLTSALDSGLHLLYVKGDISRLYSIAKKYLEKNGDGYAIVLNDNQAFGIEGESCTLALAAIGSTLEKEGILRGSVKERSFSGSLSDAARALEMLKGFEYGKK